MTMIWRVVTERAGRTTRESGVTSTELEREEFRYGAESIHVLWDGIEWLRNDPERDIVAIIQEHPLLSILEPKKFPLDPDL